MVISDTTSIDRDPPVPLSYWVFGLAFCLFASGFAALTFELVWTRLLLYAYGNTVPAVTTVVTAVMAGLALGSIAGGRIADRSARPLMVYGTLEVCLAGLCLAIPSILERVRSVYLHFYPSLPKSYGTTGILLQYGLTLAALFVPSLIMGATLPAAGLSMRRAGERSGKAAAWAYGFNTLGAAAGTLATGYVLIPSLGISRTNHLAALVSGAAGIGALILARRERSRKFSPADAYPRTDRIPRSRKEWVLLVTLSVSGAVGMLLQIVWVRALTLVVGSLTYSFTCILVTFLAGIAGGSILHIRLSKTQTWQHAPPFGPLMSGIAVSAILLIPFFHSLATIFLLLSRALGSSPAWSKLIQFFVVMPVIVVPTTILGLIVPTWVGYLASEERKFGSRFGMIYAWNTVGAVFGSAVTGYFLISLAGAQNTLIIGALLAAFSGMVLSLVFGRGRPRIVAGAALALTLGAVFYPSWDPRILNMGLFYFRKQNLSLDRMISTRFSEVLYFREGTGAAVAVARFPTGSRGLIINGKVDASNRGDMETQIKLAAVPILLHPDPQRVAVIGLGSGVTSGTAALFPETRSVETIEVEPAVAEAARFFHQENHGILDDPSHRLVIGDARSHFMARGRDYDIVISEPSNPWMAGEADLFTADFFRSVRARLAPGGIFCQWIHGYVISNEALRVVTRTFQSVFPEATLWSTGNLDFLLIGGRNGPITISPDAVRGRLGGDPRLKNIAALFGNPPEEGLQEDLLLVPDELSAFSGEGPLHVDDFPTLEFLAADSLSLPSSENENLMEILEARKYSNMATRTGAFDAERRFRAGKYLLDRGRYLQAEREFSRAYTLGRKPLRKWEEGIRVPRDFVSPGDLSLTAYPAIGSYRPAETNPRKKAFAVWAGSMDHFLDSSGIEERGGKSGGTTLRVSGSAGTTYTSYFVPLSLPPSTEVKIEFDMFLPSDPRLSGGCAVMEFDESLGGKGQPSGRDTSLHLINTFVGVQIPGGLDTGWKRHSFTHRTSSITQLVHVHFFREGDHEAGDVLFGGIDVHRVR